MRTLKRYALVSWLMMTGMIGFSQQLRLGKNQYMLQKSAILELESDNQGLLFPRITDTLLINTLTPTDGLVIYHAPSKQLMVRSNGAWSALASRNLLTTDWAVGGNANGAARKLGNTDNFDLSIITNNLERLRVLANGRVGINTVTPGNFLEVGGTNAGTGITGLRLTNAGSATPAASNNKMLSVDGNGDVFVSSMPVATNWLMTGNSGTTASQFLGTTDDKAMTLKSNNSTYMQFGRRQTLGLTQGYTDYTDDDEKLLSLGAAIQFDAPNASFYKPKIFTDANGNFRIKGSSAGTDYFELGSTGINNNGGFEFIIGDDGDEPILFKSYHYINGMSEIMRLQSGRMAVGSNSFDVTNPEKLLIDAGTTSSYNLMTGKGSIDNYLQINVQNRSNGGSASSDLVATSDNGSESTNYIDMGINSSLYSNNSYPIIGGANTAYLYATGNDFAIGNGTSAKNLKFFTGGFTAAAERMRIDGSGNVGISTTAPAAVLDANGTSKLGAKGTVTKNVISFEVALASNTGVAGAALNTLNATFSPGVTELSLTIPASNTPTTTRASVSISADRDLPTNISIASARVSTTSVVKVRVFNNGTGSQTLASGTKFYITINEF